MTKLRFYTYYFVDYPLIALFIWNKDHFLTTGPSGSDSDYLNWNGFICCLYVYKLQFPEVSFLLVGELASFIFGDHYSVW